MSRAILLNRRSVSRHKSTDPFATVLDPFNIGANQLLTAGRLNWDTSPIWAGDSSLTTDVTPAEAILSGAVECSNRWLLSSVVNQRCWYTIAGTGKSFYSYTRLQAGTPVNGYELGWIPGSITLYKVVSNVETVIGTFTNQTQTVGGSMCLESIGTTHSVYYKAGGAPTLLGSVTDSTWTGAGDIGILGGSTSSGDLFDVFGGGAV